MIERDIVERLRGDILTIPAAVSLMEEAADEIERLRKELAEAKQQVEEEKIEGQMWPQRRD